MALSKKDALKYEIYIWEEIVKQQQATRIRPNRSAIISSLKSKGYIPKNMTTESFLCSYVCPDCPKEKGKLMLCTRCLMWEENFDCSKCPVWGELDYKCNSTLEIDGIEGEITQWNSVDEDKSLAAAEKILAMLKAAKKY